MSNGHEFKNKLPRHVSLLGLFLLLTILCAHTIKGQENSYFKKAEKLRHENTQQSIYYYKESIKEFSRKKDTSNIIKGLLELSSLYAHNVDYGNAYDGYWQALLLSEQTGDDISKARIYQELGWLYSFYSRTQDAIKYINLSLKLKKELRKKNKISAGFILSDYFSMINLYRINNDLEKVEIYLDSCNQMQKEIGKDKNLYIEAERGYFDAQNKNYDLSFKKLFAARAHFEKENPSYLVIIDYLIGAVHNLAGNPEESILFYKKSLAFSKEYHSHTNYRLFGYEALSLAYSQIGDYRNAYTYRTKATTLNEKIFGRQSKNNQHLFEIKDQYRVQKEKENELIQKQRIANLETEKKVLNLKFALMFVVVASLFVLGYLIIQNVYRKHKIEKIATAEKQKLELQKSNEILELKNKELTTTALQLIEKDEFIEKLRNTISGNRTVDVKSINRMLKTIQGTPNNNWKQFEARFTAINQSFYKNIKEKYTNLGQTDLKMCALIKLNFSSKEMSSLLGISVESVHTSRHRLRKKLKLDRSQNLTEFIASF